MRPPTITCFRDAVGLAMELSDEYAFVNAALLVDAGGHLVDGAVHDGIGHPIDPVVEWAVDRVIDTAPPPGCAVVLVSVRSVDDTVVREEDLRRYRAAGRQIAATGAALADWIETDGDVFRSYAYVVHPGTAWLDDPGTHRLADGRPP